MGKADTSSDSVQRLRDILTQASTRDILERCHKESVSFDAGQIALMSKARQLQLLLRVAMESSEPDAATPLTDRQWNMMVKELNQIFFGAQVDSFLTSGPETLPAQFAQFHYYNNTLLAEPQQIAQAINTDLVQFDDVLLSNVGITATRSLELSLAIFGSLQDGVSAGEHTHLQKLFSTPPVASSDGSPPSFEQRLIDLHRLHEGFGRDAETFLDLFSIGRGDGPPVEHSHERNPIESLVFFRVDAKEAFWFSWNSVLEGVYRGLEDAIWETGARDSYARRRAKRLETDAFKYIKAISGRHMCVMQNVFETPERRDEHDIVAFDEQRCIIVEVKSTRLKPPLHDPSKAYERLRQAMKSSTGIQHAYRQAAALRSRVIGDGATLYNQKGEVIASIPKLSPENVVCVCVTLDSFGPLATYGLNQLIDPLPEQPFPWVVNIWDLESIALAWQEFRWDFRHFWNFLSQRLRLAQHLMADDELDYAGAYIRHIGLEGLANATDTPQFLHPWNQDIFEALYRSSGHDRRRFILEPLPAFRDKSNRPVTKVARNAPCPCQSGFKFKRCHGTI